MNTFLPFADFDKSCQVLDLKRLANQRRECVTLLGAISPEGNGWKNHPAAKQWVGYDGALKLYLFKLIVWCINRGLKNRMEFPDLEPRCKMPPWLGHEPYHASHRANLLRKDPKWYGQFGWTEDPALPYVWPSKIDDFRVGG